MSKLFVIVNFQDIFCEHNLSDEQYQHAAYAIYNKVESLLRYISSGMHKNNTVICIYEGDYDLTEFHKSYFYKRFSDKNIRLSQGLCNLTYKPFDEIEVCGLFMDQSVLKYLLLLKERFPDVKMIVDLQCCTDMAVKADNEVLSEMEKHNIEIIGQLPHAL